MEEEGDPVIDTPVVDVGGGSALKIQCSLAVSPRRQIETESVPNEAERKTEQSEQSQGCEISINRIKFKASSKEIELTFMCEDTRGAGRTVQHKVTISHLVPASVYKIQIIQFTEDAQVWELDQCILTKVRFGPPVDFRVAEQHDGKFFFAWEKPIVEDDYTIDFYIISVYIYTESGLHGHKNVEKKINSRYLCALIRLEEEMSYAFEVQAGCGDFLSKPTRRQWTVLKHEMVYDGKMLNSVGKPTYLVDAVTTDERENICLKEIGKEFYSEVTQFGKVILVLGQTGAGKTTWINTMLNYLLDVNYTDDFRFKLVIEENAERQELSQTQITTLYKIHHKKGYNIDHTLNLIDTPGFGDTGGIERDKDIAKQLQSIFDIHYGFVDHLDAVVFVTKSNQERLDDCQKYIISSITELFGADIADNIYLVFTHTGIEEPAMLSTLQGAELPYKAYYKFENAAVFTDIQKHADERENSHTNQNTLCKLKNIKELEREVLYETAMDNFEEFFSDVQSAPSKGLAATRNVLHRRITLQQNINNLNNLVQNVLNHMDELETVVMATTKWDDEIKQTKNYVEIDVETVKTMVEKSGLRGTTVCIECNHTCHKDCLVYFDCMKSICEVMDRSSSPPSCTKCPKKCTWKHHKNLKYIYEDQLETVQRILFDHKRRYEEAQAKKLTNEELCNNIQIELKAMEAKMKAYLSEITDSIHELRKIGMKRDEPSQVSYIDSLIEREKRNANPGMKNKLDILYGLRKQAKDMIDTGKCEYDSFRLYWEKKKQICEENPDIKELDLWINVANTVKHAAKQMGSDQLGDGLL